MQVEKLARDQMKQTIPNYSNVGVGEAWDHLQSKVRQSYTAQHANVTIHRTLWAISGPPTLGMSSRFTSCGSESIRYWVYKHCAVELTRIFERHSVIRHPPASRKHSTVTPTPNLRPVSVIPLLLAMSKDFSLSVTYSLAVPTSHL